MKQYDHECYQGVNSENIYVKVSELTEQEAKDCLCNMYDLMEELEEKFNTATSGLNEIMENWWK